MSLVLLATLTFSACARKHIEPELVFPSTVFSRDHGGISTEHIRRVVVLAPENASAAEEALIQDIQQAIAESIREHDIYEVIEVPSGASRAKCTEWIKAGEFPISLLCEMHEKYNADAVMFVSVGRIRAVAPVSADISLRLVDTNEGVMFRSVDGQWTMSNPTTLKRAVKKSGNSFDNMNSQLVAQSPRALFGVLGEDVAMELARQKSGFGHSTIQPMAQ